MHYQESYRKFLYMPEEDNIGFIREEEHLVPVYTSEIKIIESDIDNILKGR